MNEVFASAMEHGETEQQIIQRLGTPKEFADSTAEQFGIDNTNSKKRNGIISVSYTHLDVYKRQLKYRVIRFIHILRI